MNNTISGNIIASLDDGERWDVVAYLYRLSTTAEELDTGKQLYEANCASCHGPELQGTDKGPPFLHRVYEPSHHGDAAFQMAARNGVRAHHWKFGDMLPVPGLKPDDVAHITAYVRMQQRKAGIR